MSAEEFYVVKWETVSGEIDAKRVRSRQFPRVTIDEYNDAPSVITVDVKTKNGWECQVYTLARRFIAVQAEGN